MLLGILKIEDIAVLPDPSDSHTWLIVTESSIYHHKFEEKEPTGDYTTYFFDFLTNRWKPLMESSTTCVELPLPRKERILLYFNYMQRVENGPFHPTLGVRLVRGESQACKSPGSSTVRSVFDITTIQIIIDALGKRIQTAYRSFSELNYQKISRDDFITALNICTGIDGRLDSIIEQEKTKF